MPVFVIVDIDIHDPEGFAEYRAKVPATIEAHGGRYLARGGATEVLEGSWEPKRCVLLEFPDMASFRRWWTSPEYVELSKIRHRTTTGNLIVTQGL
jgi:uncharacterized protein (DUF1330 family)